jgi:hypothetical protein
MYLNVFIYLFNWLINSFYLIEQIWEHHEKTTNKWWTPWIHRERDDEAIDIFAIWIGK